jgi:hypothetical protein
MNQGAALLLASEDGDAARHPRARWVYPWAGVDVTEQWFVQTRLPFAAGGAARGGVGAGGGRCRSGRWHLTLLLLRSRRGSRRGRARDDTRPLTVTGGLPWFGGPGNNYSTHAIATMMEGGGAGEHRAGACARVVSHEARLGVYSTEGRRGGGEGRWAELQGGWCVAASRGREARRRDAGRSRRIQSSMGATGRRRRVRDRRLEDRRRFIGVPPREGGPRAMTSTSSAGERSRPTAASSIQGDRRGPPPARRRDLRLPALRLWHRDGPTPAGTFLGPPRACDSSRQSPAAIVTWLREHQFDPSLGWNVYGVPSSSSPAR